MSRRIDIELTSALGDGTWTWRAAGARQPKGVLDGSILPTDAKIGDEIKVEVEQEIDGITVIGVVEGRDKPSRPDVIELLPAERDFQPVVETRARRDRGDRGDRARDGDRRPRRDRDGREGDRPDRGRGEGRRGTGGGRTEGERGRPARRGPSFTPPPEVPQRPKPKRLRPGKQHLDAVLADLPEEQRPVAELALQGLGAVRQRLREENERAVAAGRAAMPEASVMKMAEELLPKLRVAEWRDRAEAALRQLEHLDLRDLRSVVAASGDPILTRDESTGELITQLQAALVRKQDEELRLWFADVDAALAVGRVIRALRLSSQPPKAGVPFPVDIAKRLVDSTNASLAPMDGPERWAAMLEAAAFSPIRTLVQPARKPDAVNDELLATVKRLAPALPQVAALFEIEVDPKAPMPKPLRPGPRGRPDAAGKPRRTQGGRPAGEKRSGGRRGEVRPGDDRAAAHTTGAETPAGPPVGADPPTPVIPPPPATAASATTPDTEPTSTTTPDPEPTAVSDAASEPAPAAEPETPAERVAEPEPDLEPAAATSQVATPEGAPESADAAPSDEASTSTGTG
jgi:hypothetical protein